MGRTLPAVGTNQIAGFVEYRPLTDWEKNNMWYQVNFVVTQAKSPWVECMQGFRKLSADDIFSTFTGSCDHLSITPAPNQTYLHFSDTNKQKKIVKYSQELWKTLSVCLHVTRKYFIIIGLHKNFSKTLKAVPRFFFKFVIPFIN